ncbi:integrase arm-type DNA-binding domain-containing protein [Marinobacterium sp. D7]|uniref:tyrosine-type recombinase/integrase n=1 Tax=Marinobacterium ramblicola TaxID=2849041 RepID=UPI001C2D34AD|nr:site-specific integrase [Marinobacterium ramblicola]MBV1786751.1 integrase arm-type DNA-binding domain-containing protein [Marinobacterium ramblicola]
MPKVARPLTDAAVRKLRHKGPKTPGTYSVGGVAGLQLVCKPPADGSDIGPRSWVLRVKVGDRRRDIGLGPYPEVSLSEARERAKQDKELIRQGVDPLEHRKALRSALAANQAKAVTFAEVAREYIDKKAAEFKTLKQVQKLTGQLETYAYPFLDNLVISDIERAHIVKMLEPIWISRHETASRVRLSVERVLDLAGVKGLRSGDNPARWKGNLELSFPAAKKVAKVKHYNSLPVDQMTAFWKDLADLQTVGASVLKFTILTACRPGEARDVRWTEIDLESKIWTIPAERMKGGKAHKIPLTASAVKLVEAQPRLSEYVFAGPRKGRPITDVAVSKVPKLLGHDVTAHGFRSTFRTWAQEYTSYAEEICELALAHVNSDATRAAYARGELVDKRRLLMSDWEHFILNGHLNHEVDGGKIVAIGGRS